jgi:type 1 fimbria pilin
MVFDGNILDATHTVNWGNWTASFPFGQMPVAKYFQANSQPGSISSTVISGLSCSNSISGSQSCSITIAYGIPNVGDVCTLLGSPPNFQISCPDSPVFAQ